MIPLDEEVVVPRNPWVSSMRVVVGVLLTVFGVSLARDMADVALTVIALAAMVIGLSQVIVGGHQLVTRSTALRANADGIWFGGGRVVPWDAIAAIYEVHAQVSVNFVPVGKGSIVRIDFHRVGTTFRLPLSAWPMALVREGVHLHDARPVVMVARLEALRARACGADTAGAVPAARVVER